MSPAVGAARRAQLGEEARLGARMGRSSVGWREEGAAPAWGGVARMGQRRLGVAQ
jgi:hypothetical protein